MRWITRERPKIDRVACPWLITRFIDPQAEFLFAPSAEVLVRATELHAIPYDVEGVELSHDGPRCSFDAFLHKYALITASSCKAGSVNAYLWRKASKLQRGRHGPPRHCTAGGGIARHFPGPVPPLPR